MTRAYAGTGSLAREGMGYCMGHRRLPAEESAWEDGKALLAAWEVGRLKCREEAEALCPQRLIVDADRGHRASASSLGMHQAGGGEACGLLAEQTAGAWNAPRGRRICPGAHIFRK